MMSLIPPIIQPMAAILFILISLTSAQSMQDTSAPETLSGTTTDPNTIKILVCGDSISQGIDGDFTWRYRLWEWFQKNALESPPPSQITTTQTTTPTLHYVGPYNGTLPTTVGDDVDLNQPQTWGTYHETVDPAFWPGGGSHHFAVYGRPAWMDIDLVGEQVTTYGPDLVILHMGFNDIGWWSQTAAELIETVSKLVWNIRMARSDVKILVADVSHRMQVTGRDDIPRVTDEYNGMLREKVLEWSTTESPVVAVKVSEEYGCHIHGCPAGIDGLHPNALGEFQIARAYTKVLHDIFHFGSGPLIVPDIDISTGMEILPSPPPPPPTAQSIGGSGISSTTTSTSTSTSTNNRTFSYPSNGILLMGFSFMCLIGVVVLRPRLMKALRGGSLDKYRLLPSTSRDYVTEVR